MINLFRKLFGSKKRERPADPGKPTPIQAYDSFGRQLQIDRAEWRDKVLPNSIKDSWNDPERLYSVVVQALDDGFRDEVADAARHLYETDPQRDRGTCVWAVLLMEQQRVDEAERLLQNYLSKHGTSGFVLTNLAKIQSRRQQTALSEQTLWKALEADPNQKNALDWYTKLESQKLGDAGRDAALRRIANLPGAWRPQLSLARSALEARQLDEAMSLYHAALSRAPSPIPDDLLMQISGDLGNSGRIVELIELTAPRFDPKQHGVRFGNNLIKAYIHLDQLDDAKRIIEQLYAQNRPDWNELLQFWEAELAKARVARAPSPAEPLEFTLLTVECPLWVGDDERVQRLYGLDVRGTERVAFIGSTVSKSGDETPSGQAAQLQIADVPGRISRVLPTIFGELIATRLRCETRVLIPWIVRPNLAFALFGSPLTDESAAAHARGDTPAEFVVASHLELNGETFVATLRLIRTINAEVLHTVTGSFDIRDARAPVLAMANELELALQSHAGLSPRPSLPTYTLPENRLFGDYLLRLEQLLTLNCYSRFENGSQCLHGEREMLSGAIQLCATLPQSINARLVLAEMLTGMKKLRPEIVESFRERVRRLELEHPIQSADAQFIARRITDALD